MTELFAVKTATGFVPYDDEDHEKYRKIRGKHPVKIVVKTVNPRNFEFHKKFFALINTAWEYQNEVNTEFFKDVEGFRKTLQVLAGWSERYYNCTRGEWIEMPKSIAFDKMDELEFEELYNRVHGIICTNFLCGATKEEFDEILKFQ